MYYSYQRLPGMTRIILYVLVRVPGAPVCVIRTAYVRNVYISELNNGVFLTTT